MTYTKTFEDEHLLEAGNYQFQAVPRDKTAFNERYGFYDGDKYLAHAYTKGCASPYAVAYEKNSVRGNVAGGNGNYFQGGSCDKSSAAFAVGVLVLLNNVKTGAALDAVNELSAMHKTEHDDKHHLRGADIGHSMAALYDALSKSDKKGDNAYINEMVEWKSGSPFNLTEVGQESPDNLDIACVLWIRDMEKRGKSYFNEAEMAKAKQYINETLNSDTTRQEMSKADAAEKGGGAPEEKVDDTTPAKAEAPEATQSS